jgi:group I intron endonuclease
MCMICGIYGFQNRTHPNKWYVGLSSTIEKRFNNYRKFQCKGQPKFYRALLEFGYDGFEKVILEECDESKLGEREIYWTNFYNSVKNGYNLREGGHRGKHSEESKTKMSKSHMGKIITDSQKLKLSTSHIGLKHSEETKLKIRMSTKGIFKGMATQETRNKMRDAQQRRRDKEKQVIITSV